MTDEYDVLRDAVLEYAPVALNEIVEHFAPLAGDPARLRRLGDLATEFVLASPFGTLPDELSTELRDAVQESIRTIAPLGPAEAEQLIAQAFALADEFAVRRAAASGVSPVVIRHFADVMRNLGRLVQEAVSQALAPEPDVSETDDAHVPDSTRHT